LELSEYEIKKIIFEKANLTISIEILGANSDVAIFIDYTSKKNMHHVTDFTKAVEYLNKYSKQAGEYCE